MRCRWYLTGRANIKASAVRARLPLEAFEALTAMRLEYDKKITLAVSLGLPSEFKSALRKLGEIRNAFAHNLDATLAEDNVGSLVRVFDAEMKDIMQQSYARAFNLDEPDLD
jgi:hypothetical protein